MKRRTKAYLSRMRLLLPLELVCYAPGKALDTHKVDVCLVLLLISWFFLRTSKHCKVRPCSWTFSQHPLEDGVLAKIDSHDKTI